MDGITNHNKLVFVDVETTGLDHNKGHRIIELGAIAMEDGKIVSEFQSLIFVKHLIPRHVSQIHRITNGMLVDQPTPEQIYPKFKEFISDSLLVAHNADFDMRFLRAEFGRLNLLLQNKSICTLKMSRRRYPHLMNHKLLTVYKYLVGRVGERIQNLGADRMYYQNQRHRALDDARMVAEIWLVMGG